MSFLSSPLPDPEPLCATPRFYKLLEFHTAVSVVYTPNAPAISVFKRYSLLPPKDNFYYVRCHINNSSRRSMRE
jgi:hypothetical protein